MMKKEELKELEEKDSEWLSNPKGGSRAAYRCRSVRAF